MLAFLLLFPVIAEAQYSKFSPPNRIYDGLFTDIQMNRIFPDNKTFVDCVPLRDPQAILADYLKLKGNPNVRYSLKMFVDKNFSLPSKPASNFSSSAEESVTQHINRLWGGLKRVPDKQVKGSSLLPLPYSYIVPGGRFGEIFYWDSYFTMLGLQTSGQYEMMENMIKNFSFMIDNYGHIPNGNRTYFLSRSQPPFFSMMLEVLSEPKGEKVYADYLSEMQKEYDYWMDKTAATRHVVKMPDGSILNRYYDQDDVPRQESFYEDSTLAINYKGDRKVLYRNLRSGAESGWDFSSRWFADGKTLATVKVLDMVPVDLNGLLYHLELSLQKGYEQKKNSARANYYKQQATKRKDAINKYCWSQKEGWYFDYDLSTHSLSNEMTLAGLSPFFFRIAPQPYIIPASKVVESQFLKAGGVVTTLKNTGQQWDSPNGWAPLQWMSIKGLDNYGSKTLASEIARRWVNLNIKVYKATGKMMEKYNVVNTTLTAGGGEYPSQDGFGWTNGVLLKLMHDYNLKGN
ncbi:MAG: trehalase [Chitinophagaceae bacterium]|nr:trehalase [Chitinophagaceae bacterium]